WAATISDVDFAKVRASSIVDGFNAIGSVEFVLVETSINGFYVSITATGLVSAGLYFPGIVAGGYVGGRVIFAVPNYGLGAFALAAQSERAHDGVAGIF